MLQITESLNVEFGGLATACAQLANHLVAAGTAVTAVTVDGGQSERRCALDARVEAVRCAPSWPGRLGYSRSLGAALGSMKPDVVHVHGLWRLYLAQAARFAHSRGVPVIVSTHGMLHAPARRQRGAFKQMERRLFQDDVLRRARCLHATADDEADEIRKLGFNTPIAVIPWGVELPDSSSAPHAASDQPVVLFLGRIHPTKGLDTLLRAWARVCGRCPSARLTLAGYGDGGYRERLISLAASLGIAGSVTIEGPVDSAGRERLFAAASLLVLPSPSENFGLVVPEALVRGLPVVATHGAPWSCVVAERCGWWVPPAEDAVAGALAEALDSAPAALREMGERGRRFARATFVWDRVAAAMVALYAWTLGEGPEPAFVRH